MTEFNKKRLEAFKAECLAWADFFASEKRVQMHDSLKIIHGKLMSPTLELCVPEETKEPKKSNKKNGDA